MKYPRIARFLALILALSGAASASAQSDMRICTTVMPTAAALSSDGTVGIRFSSDSFEETPLYFSSFRPIKTSDYCFSGAAKKMITDSCLLFLAQDDTPISINPVEQQPITAPVCTTKSKRIKDLEKRNARLKSRVQYLESLRNK